jgi:hypothetical protein
VKTEFGEAAKIPKEERLKYKDIPYLEAKDIAESVLYVLGTPPHVQVSVSLHKRHYVCNDQGGPKPGFLGLNCRIALFLGNLYFVRSSYYVLKCINTVAAGHPGSSSSLTLYPPRHWAQS